MLSSQTHLTQSPRLVGFELMTLSEEQTNLDKTATFYQHTPPSYSFENTSHIKKRGGRPKLNIYF